MIAQLLDSDQYDGVASHNFNKWVYHEFQVLLLSVILTEVCHEKNRYYLSFVADFLPDFLLLELDPIAPTAADFFSFCSS